ncbi:MAG: LacI family transcriptional regulator [bacterium]|nr:LacI family transcriptional regulator [bacterium]
MPYEIALVGCDNRVGDAFTMSPLTTVHQPIYEAAYQAAQLLLAKIREEDIPQQVVLPTKLVVRQSCGCLLPEARRIPSRTMNDPKESLEAAIMLHRDRIITQYP